MPIGHFVEIERPKLNELLQRLTREWQAPDPQASEPILLEQPNPRRDGAVYLYVIWDEWQPLMPQERSELIMEAYAATHTKQEILKVTAATGLTRNEAISKRIRYTTENAA